MNKDKKKRQLEGCGDMEEHRGLGKHWWISKVGNILINIEVEGNIQDLYHYLGFLICSWAASWRS